MPALRDANGARPRPIAPALRAALGAGVPLCAGSVAAWQLGGGLLGIIVGVAAAVGLSGRAVSGQQMVTVVQPWSIGIAFVVAAGSAR